MEELYATINYYNQSLRVILPYDYSKFENGLSSMLQISNDILKNLSIYYIDQIDNKQYSIDNSENYWTFLEKVKNKNTNIIYVELANSLEKNEIKNDIQNKNIENDDDLLENPYKESFEEENNINNINNINIIKEDELKFSSLKKQENKNEQNKISNLKCSSCKCDLFLGTVYYCKDCAIFWCTKCEIEKGKTHKHCYYKIRNKSQYEEIFNTSDNDKKNNDKIKKDENNSSQISNFISQATKTLEDNFNILVSYITSDDNYPN
jgi:hypothetical protein